MFTFIAQVENETAPEASSYGWGQNRKKYLTKVWHSPTKTTDIYLAKHFDVVEEVTPASMEELRTLVLKYSQDPNVCMLQHALAEGAPRKNIRRNKETFSVVPKSKFMVFDIDSFPRPEHIDPLDIHQQAKYVLDLLSERFPVYFDKKCGYIARGSSSAGIKTDTIRMHLYLENTVPVNTKQLDTIADEVNEVFNEEFKCDLFDDSLYTRAHILYTADPIFEGCMEDPFGEMPRTVFYKSRVTASIPPTTEEKERVKTATLTEEDLESIKRFQGTDIITPPVRRVLDDIEENPDNVYTKKAPRLFFLAMEDGIGFEPLKEAFTIAMQDHPKIVSGERSIDDYLKAAMEFCFQTIKSRAIRTIPEKIDIRIKPYEEIPPEVRKDILTDWPVEKLYPDGAGTDNGYLHIPDMPPVGKLTFWKASLGTGKTTALQRLVLGDEILGIKPKFHGRMLAITNTVSLVDGNAAKLGAPTDKAYLDPAHRDSFRQNPNGRMSTTIHSLWRFKEMAEEGAIDFVFIDECDAVMDTLLNASAVIMKERAKCIDALSTILRRAKYVVLADGDISEETMFSYFALSDKEVAAVDYKFNKLEGSKAYECKKEETVWLSGVHANLDEGLKVLVVSDLGPKAINERVRGLEMLHPGHVIKGVHSESTKDEDIRDILENTNAALAQYNVDCLVCSPSVVSGVDFHYFDVVAMITNTKIAPPNLRFQALRRCRKPNKEYWIYTDPDTSNFSTGYFRAGNTYPSLEDLMREKFALRKNAEFSGFKSNLRFMLMDQGCEVVVDDLFEAGPGETLETTVKDMCGEGAKAAEREAMIYAILMSREDHFPRRYNNAFEVKQQIAHYYELPSVDAISYDHVDMYIDQDIHSKMANLAEVVRGGLYGLMKVNASTLERFTKFLRVHAIQWYNATGENAFTGYGRKMNMRNAKYQASRIGLVIDIEDKGVEPNWEQLHDWARKYYEYEELAIPKEFLTAEEKAKLAEAASDLNHKLQREEEASDDYGSLSWVNVKGFS